MSSRKKVELLVLCRYRWNLPLLAAFGRKGGWRVAPLLKSLGASRAAFHQALAHLQALGLLRPNPGHGHPLRPEYLLAEGWKELAEAVAGLEAPFGDPPELLRDRWVLPLLLELGEERRFSELARRLRPIGDRALSLALGRLEQGGFLRKSLLPSRPPAFAYSRQLDPGASAALERLEDALPAHR